MDYEQKEIHQPLGKTLTEEEIARENSNGWMLHSASPWMTWGGVEKVGWYTLRYVFRRKLDKKMS